MEIKVNQALALIADLQEGSIIDTEQETIAVTGLGYQVAEVGTGCYIGNGWDEPREEITEEEIQDTEVTVEVAIDIDGGQVSLSIESVLDGYHHGSLEEINIDQEGLKEALIECLASTLEVFAMVA